MAPRVVFPPPPVAAPEIAALGKQLAGTWTCTGALTGKLEVALALDDAWIRLTGTLTVDGRTAKLSEYRTYDAVANRWTRIAMTSASGHELSTSLGEQVGMWTWDRSATLRDHEQHAAKRLVMWGEIMTDGRWQNRYEATCKK